MESRITDLEIKISYTEDLLDELNRIVFRQQQQIDLLAKEVRSLREQSQTTQAQEPGNLRDELPPHY